MSSDLNALSHRLRSVQRELRRVVLPAIGDPARRDRDALTIGDLIEIAEGRAPASPAMREAAMRAVELFDRIEVDAAEGSFEDIVARLEGDELDELCDVLRDAILASGERIPLGVLAPNSTEFSAQATKEEQ